MIIIINCILCNTLCFIKKQRVDLLCWHCGEKNYLYVLQSSHTRHHLRIRMMIKAVSKLASCLPFTSQRLLCSWYNRSIESFSQQNLCMCLNLRMNRVFRESTVAAYSVSELIWISSPASKHPVHGCGRAVAHSLGDAVSSSRRLDLARQRLVVLPSLPWLLLVAGAAQRTHGRRQLLLGSTHQQPNVGIRKILREFGALARPKTHSPCKFTFLSSCSRLTLRNLLNESCLCPSLPGEVRSQLVLAISLHVLCRCIQMTYSIAFVFFCFFFLNVYWSE